MPEYEQANKIIKAINTRLAKMQEERDTWRDMWSDIIEYMLPWHGVNLSGENSEEVTKGSARLESVFDATGIKALRTLAAGMHSGLTSPAQPWFKLTLEDQLLVKQKPVMQWLAEVEKVIRKVCAKSNLYQALQQYYLELGGPGTAAMGVFFDYDTVIRVVPYTIGEYYIGANTAGRVNTFYSKRWFTAAQLVETFGEDNVSEAVKNVINGNTPDERFLVIYAVEPNDKRIENLATRGRAYREVYFEASNPESKLLRLSGFDNFPFMVTRWNTVSTRVWGDSPAMVALREVKMLQKLQSKGLVALEKNVDPPLVGPAGLKPDMVNSAPGGYTAVTDNMMAERILPLYQVSFDLRSLEAWRESTRTEIKDHMYTNLFLLLEAMPGNRQMTATEVMIRNREKLLQLGPVLERVYTELLDPLIKRIYHILDNYTDLLPPRPDELLDVDFNIEYISVLARAQQVAEVSSIEQGLQFAGATAQLSPEVLDVIDGDRALLNYLESISFPADALRDDASIEAIREARSQQMQAQQMVENMQPMANSAKSLSEVNVDNQVLQNLMAGLQQGGANVGGVPQQ